VPGARREIQYRFDLGARRMPDAANADTLLRVSLAQIEYFLAVADAGHVGRAARRLHVAQPAVSRQIRKLEDELEAPLFLRTPRGMRLSEAGVVFLAHARAIAQSVGAARDAVRAIDHGGRA
jgi:DNA-binding transcriptional LysR family regulator